MSSKFASDLAVVATELEDIQEAKENPGFIRLASSDPSDGQDEESVDSLTCLLSIYVSGVLPPLVGTLPGISEALLDIRDHLVWNDFEVSILQGDGALERENPFHGVTEGITASDQPAVSPELWISLCCEVEQMHERLSEQVCLFADSPTSANPPEQMFLALDGLWRTSLAMSWELYRLGCLCSHVRQT